MSQKTIHYQRKGVCWTFSKEEFSSDEFEMVIPLFENHLHQFGYQTFSEFLKSYSNPGAAASAFAIGGKHFRKKHLSDAIENNGEVVDIVFIFDLDSKELIVESELSNEAIALELRVLDIYHYNSQTDE